MIMEVSLLIIKLLLLEAAGAAVVGSAAGGPPPGAPPARSDGMCVFTYGSRCAGDGTLLLSTDGIANTYGCDEKCFENKDCNW